MPVNNFDVVLIKKGANRIALSSTSGKNEAKYFTIHLYPVLWKTQLNLESEREYKCICKVDFDD